MYFLYIVRDSRNNLYIGQTNNLEKRLQYHRNGNGAKFLKNNSTIELAFSERYETRSEAMNREAQLKKWTRAKKEALIDGNLDLLKKL